MSPTQQSVSADAQLAAELRPSVMRLRRRLATERDPDNDLSLSATAVLGCLFRNGPTTVGRLAAFECVQPPSMTRTVSCLAEEGYVTRRPDENDGRVVLVELTDKGRAMLVADRRRRDAWLTRRLGELTDEERAVLRQAAPILERMAEA